MRRVYLVRHGHPDFPLDAHMCLGRTDTPLGPLGRMQAVLLGEKAQDAILTAVFCSPLIRCRETAAPLGLAPTIVPALAEQDMGPWDGLDFDTIRRDWPELYARREREALLVPPGAETLEQVSARVLPAFRACLAQSQGDIAVVAHASVIQAILAELTGTPLEESRSLRPPYGSYAVLEGEPLTVSKLEQLPRPQMCPGLARKLLAAAAPGERVEAHCRAVAAEAERIAFSLILRYDMRQLLSAALLHDVARKEKDHAAVGARWLWDLGYRDIAGLILEHHDLKGDGMDEHAILYMADKCILEDRRVTLSERFAASESRCTTPEARAAHAARRDAAFRMRDRINELHGSTLIE
ncbi:MAG: histidine phosphatase family protein [Oscillospiraceae bacterium]|nr:histidine phosphatase family protein [Oscillospiraceae bacterium]